MKFYKLMLFSLLINSYTLKAGKAPYILEELAKKTFDKSIPTYYSESKCQRLLKYLIKNTDKLEYKTKSKDKKAYQKKGNSFDERENIFLSDYIKCYKLLHSVYVLDLKICKDDLFVLKKKLNEKCMKAVKARKFNPDCHLRNNIMVLIDDFWLLQE